MTIVVTPCLSYGATTVWSGQCRDRTDRAGALYPIITPSCCGTDPLPVPSSVLLCTLELTPTPAKGEEKKKQRSFRSSCCVFSPEIDSFTPWSLVDLQFVGHSGLKGKARSRKWVTFDQGRKGGREQGIWIHFSKLGDFSLAQRKFLRGFYKSHVYFILVAHPGFQVHSSS